MCFQRHSLCMRTLQHPSVVLNSLGPLTAPASLSCELWAVHTGEHALIPPNAIPLPRCGSLSSLGMLPPVSSEVLPMPSNALFSSKAACELTPARTSLCAHNTLVIPRRWTEDTKLKAPNVAFSLLYFPCLFPKLKFQRCIIVIYCLVFFFKETFH